MVQIPQMFGPVLAHLPAPWLLLALLGASLVLIFAGGTLAKVVAFLAVGLVGAALAGTLAVQYMAQGWALVAILLGFLLGGLLGVALLPLGVGLAVGYAGYLFALAIALGPTYAIIFGVAFFIVGAVLSSKILSVSMAVLGGLLLFNLLTSFGLGSMFATLVAALLTLLGIWVQLSTNRIKVGGQPS